MADRRPDPGDCYDEVPDKKQPLHQIISLFEFLSNTGYLLGIFKMPDVSKHVAVLQDLKNGTYPTLGVNIGSREVTPGEKIAKGGKESIHRMILIMMKPG